MEQTKNKISFSVFEHQNVVMSTLREKVKKGEISEEEAIKIYKEWKELRCKALNKKEK